MFEINDYDQVSAVMLDTGKTWYIRQGSFTEGEDTYSFEYHTGKWNGRCRMSVHKNVVVAVTEDVVA